MSLTQKINDDIKQAMKSQDRDTLTALRDIKSQIMLEMTKEGRGGEVDDADVLKILNKLYKQRIDAAGIYEAQQRQDLADVEIQQSTVIKKYLPEPLGESEIENIVSKIVHDTGASSMADMGKVMGLASEQIAGRADGKAVSQVVRKLLTK